MRRRMTPIARLALGAAAALTVSALAGCGVVADPLPTPTPTESAAAEPTTAPTTPAKPPTTVTGMPGTAFLRVTATAEVGDESVRLELTFARAQVAAANAAAFAGVQEECPNAITSQLEVHPGLEPTGVLTSELAMVGAWPEGLSVAIAAGGTIASYGEGTNVAPTEDEVGMFGCTVPIVTGPGTARFVSLLLGDPAITDRIDLDQQLALGLFGFETDSGSEATVRWRDCVIQLSSAAQRLATASAWTTQSQGSVGCVIGDEGTA